MIYERSRGEEGMAALRDEMPEEAGRLLGAGNWLSGVEAVKHARGSPD
jgi:hypothetical protein